LCRVKSFGDQLFVGKETNRLDAIAQIAPELGDIFRSGKATRDADNCDAINGDVDVGITH
jgi:hypothetical protein